MKNKNIFAFCIFLSLFTTKCSASSVAYERLAGENSDQVSAQSGCCGISIKDSKIHRKHCMHFSAFSSLLGVETVALSFGAAYSSSKIVCIGLTATSACTGCMACAAVALATRECTLALVARKQERLQQQKPVNIPAQHVMDNEQKTINP